MKVTLMCSLEYFFRLKSSIKEKESTTQFLKITFRQHIKKDTLPGDLFSHLCLNAHINVSEYLSSRNHTYIIMAIITTLDDIPEMHLVVNEWAKSLSCSQHVDRVWVSVQTQPFPGLGFLRNSTKNSIDLRLTCLPSTLLDTYIPNRQSFPHEAH